MGTGAKIGIVVAIVAVIAGIGLASPLFYDVDVNEPLPTGDSSGSVNDVADSILGTIIEESVDALDDPAESLVATLSSFTVDEMMDVEMLKESANMLEEKGVPMEIAEDIMLATFQSMDDDDREKLENNPNNFVVDMLMNAAARTETTASDEMDMPTGPTILKMGTFEGVAGHRASGIVKLLDVEGSNYLRFEDFSVTNGPDLRVYVSSDNTVSNGIHLEKLKGSRGAQNYALGDIDTSKYGTVIIYCQPFGAYFAVANLA